MSLKQRRDHRPKPCVVAGKEVAMCCVCREEIILVNGYYEDRWGHAIKEHWRHWRRP